MSAGSRVVLVTGKGKIKIRSDHRQNFLGPHPTSLWARQKKIMNRGRSDSRESRGTMHGELFLGDTLVLVFYEFASPT